MRCSARCTGFGADSRSTSPAASKFSDKDHSKRRETRPSSMALESVVGELMPDDVSAQAQQAESVAGRERHTGVKVEEAQNDFSDPPRRRVCCSLWSSAKAICAARWTNFLSNITKNETIPVDFY